MRLPGFVDKKRVPDTRVVLLDLEQQHFYQARGEWDKILLIRRSPRGITVRTMKGTDSWKKTEDGWRVNPRPRQKLIPEYN